MNAALQDDDNTNFTAIWVFKPAEKSFKVYQEFDIVPNKDDTNEPFKLVKPEGGYHTEHFFTQIQDV